MEKTPTAPILSGQHSSYTAPLC